MATKKVLSMRGKEILPKKAAKPVPSITTTVEAFLGALKASYPPERKSTIPVLSYARLTDNAITTTDLDSTTVTKFDAKGKIDCLIPYRLALDVLKGESGALTVTPLEDHWVLLKVGELEFKLQGMSAANFPAIPTPATTSLTLTGEVFTRMLTRTIFAISAEESRYTLNGALLLADSTGAVTMVATDGHRLALVNEQGEGNLEKTLIPRKALDYLKTRISGKVEIGLYKPEGHPGDTTFRTGNTILIARNLRGQFPNYEAVMPRDQKVTVQILDPVKFEDNLKRVAKCADERSGAIRLAFTDRGGVVSASSSERGEAQAPIACTVDGVTSVGITMGFNAGFILDLLKVTKKEPLTLSLRDNQSAGMFTVGEGTGYRYAIMPMRL